MLHLVGLGLAGDLTCEGLRIAKKSHKVYLETYTSLVPAKEKMEEMLGRSVIPLGRKQIEEEDFLVNEAQTQDVAMLVGGDPLVATTHAELLLRAKKKGVKYKIIHNASIYTAIAETGLQIYRFGKSSSIVFPRPNFSPASFYNAIEENLARDLHTLLFLDVIAEERLYMNPAQALRILKQLGFQGNLVVCSRLGHRNPNICYGGIEGLCGLEDDFWGPPPHILVIPANLHFMEEEFLEEFRFKKK